MKREKRLSIRISDEEKRLLEQAARKDFEAGSVGAWLRQTMIDRARIVLAQ